MPNMSINLGSTAINGLFLGSTEINKAYLGSTLVYDNTGVSNGLLNNLISYYKMDTNGSFPDAHGSNDGTINGASYTSSGKINGGYSFDGVNDNVSLGTNSDFNFTSSFSINIWVYNEENGREQAIISRYDYDNNKRQFYLYKNSGKFIFRISTNGTSGSFLYTTSTINQWTMLTAVYDSDIGQHYLYKNSILVDYASIGTPYSSTQQTGFGQLFDTPATSNFNGKMDEAPFWNKALSQEDITTLYNSGAGLPYDSFTT